MKHELKKDKIQSCIEALQRELDYHYRRSKTLTLAVQGMEGELARMERDVSADAAFEAVKETYRSHAPE